MTELGFAGFAALLVAARVASVLLGLGFGPGLAARDARRRASHH